MFGPREDFDREKYELDPENPNLLKPKKRTPQKEEEEEVRDDDSNETPLPKPTKIPRRNLMEDFEKDAQIKSVTDKKAAKAIKKVIRGLVDDYKAYKSFSELQQAKALFLLQETGKQFDRDRVDEEFERLVYNDNKYQNLVDVIAPLETLEGQLVTRMEELLQPVLVEAMQPVYQFIGAVEATERYGARHYSHYYPLKKGNKSLYEFRNNNRHLGTAVLILVADYVRREAGYIKEPIGRDNVSLIGIQYPRLTVSQKELIGADVFGLDLPNAPRWIYCLIGNDCLKFMLAHSTYAAITLAAQELGYKDFKPLIDSTDVSYMFAQFVAHKFFTSKGGNAQAAAVSGGNVQYRISSGFGTTQMANSKWLLGCKVWFKQVYWGTNGNRKGNLDALKEVEEKAERVYTYLNGQYQLIPVGEVARKREMAEVVRDAKMAWRVALSEWVVAKCEPERVLKHVQ